MSEENNLFTRLKELYNEHKLKIYEIDMYLQLIVEIINLQNQKNLVSQMENMAIYPRMNTFSKIDKMAKKLSSNPLKNLNMISSENDSNEVVNLHGIDNDEQEENNEEGNILHGDEEEGDDHNQMDISNSSNHDEESYNNVHPDEEDTEQSNPIDEDEFKEKFSKLDSENQKMVFNFLKDCKHKLANNIFYTFQQHSNFDEMELT